MSITAKVHIRSDRVALVPTQRSLDDVKILVITQGNTSPGATLLPLHIQ
jgi:hypothetical protein